MSDTEETPAAATAIVEEAEGDAPSAPESAEPTKPESTEAAAEAAAEEAIAEPEAEPEPPAWTAIVTELEEMFKDRFSENDTEYQAVVAAILPPPPVVDNWYSRPKRTSDWNSRSDFHGGYHGQQRNYHGDQRSYQGQWQNRHGGGGQGQGQGYRQDRSYYGSGGRHQRDQYGGGQQRYHPYGASGGGPRQRYNR